MAGRIGLAVALLGGLAAPALAETAPRPLRGQDVAQQAKDTADCQKLASAKSGFDPASTTVRTASATEGNGTSAKSKQPKQAIYDRERSACLSARGYKPGG